MKRLTLAMCAAALVLYACNSETKSDTATGDTATTKTETAPGNTAAADPCAGQPPADPNAMAGMDSAMMAAMVAYGTPGEAHAILAKDDGDWDGDITMWMDPAAPPTKAKGKATNKMILGGRYQEGVHVSCMHGMPFEGKSIIGYDNLKKTYVSSWVDNMGTGIMMMTGNYDAATKTIKLGGTCTNPMGGKDMKVREEFVIVDDNTRKMSMYGPDMKGKEFKMMEIVLTRKK